MPRDFPLLLFYATKHHSWLSRRQSHCSSLYYTVATSHRWLLSSWNAADLVLVTDIQMHPLLIVTVLDCGVFLTFHFMNMMQAMYPAVNKCEHLTTTTLHHPRFPRKGNWAPLAALMSAHINLLAPNLLRTSLCGPCEELELPSQQVCIESILVVHSDCQRVF